MKQLSFKQKIMIYDTIIYTCLALLFLWIILKFVGIIQTPIWLELLPYLLAGASLFAAVIKIGSFFGRLEGDIHYLKRDVHYLKQDMQDVKKKVSSQRGMIRMNTTKITKLHHMFQTHVKKYHV